MPTYASNVTNNTHKQSENQRNRQTNKTIKKRDNQIIQCTLNNRGIASLESL